MQLKASSVKIQQHAYPCSDKRNQRSIKRQATCPAVDPFLNNIKLTTRLHDNKTTSVRMYNLHAGYESLRVNLCFLLGRIMHAEAVLPSQRSKTDQLDAW